MGTGGKSRRVVLHGWRHQRAVFRITVRVCDGPPRAHSDVALYFPLRTFSILWLSSHFEAWLFVSGRCDNIGIRQLLNALDRRPFGTDYQTDNAVRHTNVDGDSFLYRRTNARSGLILHSVILAGCTNLCEMLCGSRHFTFSCRYILWSSCDNEYRIFTAGRSLDVRVGLSSQGLDLAALIWTRSEIYVKAFTQMDFVTTFTGSTHFHVA